jgi:WASH complex subunit 7
VTRHEKKYFNKLKHCLLPVLWFGRQAALSLLLEVVVSATAVFSEKDGQRLQMLVGKILRLANLQKDIITSCETSFLFFQTALLDFIVGGIYALPTEANRLQYVMSAFEDGIRLCQAVLHQPLPPFFVNYRGVLRDSLKTNIIQPLCRDIETDLRLHIHTKHLGMYV